jgi:antitoxin VapB
MTDTAKVFWSGRSQAVRLPKRFRVDAKEMRIKKQGNRIILEPIPDSWNWLDELGPFDDDFVAAVNEEPPPAEERDFGKMFDE